MAKAKAASSKVAISPPNLHTVYFEIEGTAPFVQHKFSAKAQREILVAQMAGSTAKSKKKKEARDIESDYKEALHVGIDGKYGIPAPAFRSAMISACRLVGFQMTRAKLSIFVVADTLDETDETPLVHINGEPKMHQSAVRLQNGVASIAVRPMWCEWSATVPVQFDGDQFTVEDVTNLLMRAGAQVGIGEGRPDSKNSHGMGWGTFRVVKART